MTARRATVGAALLLAVGLGCWWMLRSEPTETVASETKPASEASSLADEKPRDAASSRRSKRADAAETASTESKPDAAPSAASRTLRGVVTDPSGAPANGATVRAWWGTGNGMWAIRGGLADIDGRYECGHLPLGIPLRVIAEKTGFANVEAHDVVLDEAREDVKCDLALRASPQLDVRVHRLDGSPATDARVRVDSLTGSMPEKSVDAAGQVSIDVDRTGPVSLCVRTSSGWPQHVDVDLPPGERRAVDVTLDGSATIAGTVVDERGRPVEGTLVRPFRRDRPNEWSVENAVQGQADGSFRIPGLAPGHYRICVEKDDVVVDEALADLVAPAEGVRAVARLGGRLAFRLCLPTGATRPARVTVGVSARDWHADVSDDWKEEFEFPSGTGVCVLHLQADGFAPVERSINVAPDEVTTLPEIVLDPGIVLAGRVVDAQGRAVARSSAMASGSSGQRVYGDASGAFRIEHVAPGAVKLTASAPGFVSTTVTHVLTTDSPPLVATLHRGGVLRGVVRDAAGRPVGDVTAAVFDPQHADAEPDAKPYVDSRGVFAARLATGGRRVVVSRSGAVVSRVDVEMREGEETPCDVVVGR